MKRAKQTKTVKLPVSFRPILWSLRWKELDIDRDKEDIIMAALNEGTLIQWKWIASHYGKQKIRHVLEHRLASELHPESLQLARIAFGVKNIQYARKRAYTHS